MAFLTKTVHGEKLTGAIGSQYALVGSALGVRGYSILSLVSKYYTLLYSINLSRSARKLQRKSKIIIFQESI